jgi:hypothetical protein
MLIVIFFSFILNSEPSSILFPVFIVLFQSWPDKRIKSQESILIFLHIILFSMFLLPLSFLSLSLLWQRLQDIKSIPN